MAQLGKVNFRLMIEGWETEWVTSQAYERGITNGRTRRDGLQYDGIQISEHLDLRDARVEVGSMTLRIVSDYAMASFATEPSTLAVLGPENKIDYDELGWEVRDRSLTSNGKYLHVGTEVVKQYTSSAGPPITIGVTRQHWDTQAQGHYRKVGDQVFDIFLTDRPTSMEGRRAYLFMYGENEASDGKNLFDFSVNVDGRTLDTDDTLIWRGVVTQSPMLDDDGITWTINIDPITKLLEQEVAQLIDEPITIRGINHHGLNAFGIRVEDWDVTPITVTDYNLVGHHGTMEELVTDVNAVLATAKAAILGNEPQSLKLVTDGVNLELHMRTHAVNDTKLGVLCISSLVGATPPVDWIRRSDGARINLTTPLENDTLYYRVLGANPQAFDKHSQTEHVMFGEPAPLGRVGDPKCAWAGLLTGTAAEQVSDPYNRIHYNGPLENMAAVGDKLYINTEAGGVDMGGYYEITKLDSDAGGTYVEIDRPVQATVGSIPLNSETEIVAVKGVSGTVADFIEWLATETAVYANQGSAPFVTYADCDAFANAPKPFPHAYRDWVMWEAVSVADILAEELKLIGGIIHLASDGRITASPLDVTSGVDTSTTAITDAHIVTPFGRQGAWPTWQPARDGVVSVVKVGTIAGTVGGAAYEYDDGSTIEIRDVKSISTHKNRSRADMEIFPKSSMKSGKISPGIAFGIAQKQFAFHANDYDVVDIEVTNDLFTSIYCGQQVRVTSEHIIDGTTGTRGIANRPGYVIGREWDMDPASHSGVLTLRFNRGNYSGYAPAARIATATNVSGSTWNLTTTSQLFAPVGQVDAAYFSAGYKCVATEFDTMYPESDTCTVVSVSSTVIQVEFDSTAPWGATFTAPFDLEFKIDAGSLAAGQNDYVFNADSNLLLQDGTVGREFA